MKVEETVGTNDGKTGKITGIHSHCANDGCDLDVYWLDDDNSHPYFAWQLHLMRQQQTGLGGLSTQTQMKMVNTLWNTPRPDEVG